VKPCGQSTESCANDAYINLLVSNIQLFYILQALSVDALRKRKEFQKELHTVLPEKV